MVTFEKRMTQVPGGLLAAALMLSLTVATAHAQQTTGTPGAPSATTTIEGNQLPPRPQPFRGKIERNAAHPAQPFFIYYVPGGVHAPHHPTPEWIKKISD